MNRSNSYSSGNDKGTANDTNRVNNSNNKISQESTAKVAAMVIRKKKTNNQLAIAGAVA